MWKGQYLRNLCIYNTFSSDQADHQADHQAEKEEPINIPSKQYGDAGTKDVIGARKHKGDEVTPFSSPFPDVLTKASLVSHRETQQNQTVMGHKSA